MARVAKQKEEIKWESVTPEKAAKWLNDNTSNRKLRDGIVEKYTWDMKRDKWTRNPQPIIFYEDGELADGQHRLWAVVESGKTIDFIVHRGVSRATSLNIDTGMTRNLVDNARIGKYEGYLTNSSVGAAIIVHHGRIIRDRAMSNAERIALVEKYAEHLKYADHVMPTKRHIGTQPIRAAVARAHMYAGDHERLALFCVIMGNGVATDPVKDRAAIAFRNYMIEVASNRKVDARDTFLKAMNAISYFLRGRSLTVIKGLEEEAYPLKKK